MNKRSIATASLSGDFAHKLEAIANAGFDAVEVFENDFLTFDCGPRDAGSLITDLGMTIAAFQPFRDFEGLAEPERSRAFARAERKFDVMQELGADLMLICSSVSPLSQGGIDRAAADLAELGERAAKRGLRIGYEALAWGRHVKDYRDAWEIVRRADHPHVGLILDSFHTLALNLPVDPICAIPGDRIFLVQLADAPRLNMDLLSWSRHFRCFPGQGELPVVEFMQAIAASGYRGALSLEIFNDRFRAGAASTMARDGLRSLIDLDDRLRRATNKPAALPPPAEVLAVEFCEFAVDPHNGAALADVFARMGFEKAGTHLSKDVTHWRQGEINLVINTENDGFAHSHAIVHGPGVCGIGLRVGDVDTTITRAQQLKAHTFEQPVGPGELTIQAIRGVGGSLIYFTEPKGDLAHVWDREFRPVAREQASAPARNWLSRIDHISQAMNHEEMLSWLLFYTSLFSFERIAQAVVLDPAGIVQSQPLVSANGAVRFVLNGSQAQRTLSSRFLSEYFGAGVQHIAFASDDIFAAVEGMRAAGLTLLDIPANYYDDLDAKYGLDPTLLARLKTNNILYDRDSEGEFFQVYSQVFAQRFFFEIVQRRAYAGFGAVNAPVRLAAQSRPSETQSDLAL